MGQDDDKQRTTRDRIERMRQRLRDSNDVNALKAVLKSVLDLLADEL